MRNTGSTGAVCRAGVIRMVIFNAAVKAPSFVHKHSVKIQLFMN